MDLSGFEFGMVYGQFQVCQDKNVKLSNQQYKSCPDSMQKDRGGGVCLSITGVFQKLWCALDNKLQRGYGTAVSMGMLPPEKFLI